MIVVIIVIIIILLIAFTITVTTVIEQPNDEVSDCSLLPLSELPELLDGGSICKISGVNSGLYYYEPEDYVVSSVQTSASSVCNTDQVCIDGITSDTCNGTIPMAKLGTVRYYPFTAGNDLCDNAIM